MEACDGEGSSRGGEGMIDFLLTLNWSQIIVALIVTFGGTLMVWYRAKMKTWAGAWKRVFVGLQAIPELQADVRGIRYFVSPNGGGSLMDSAKRMEEAISTLSERLEMLTQTVWAENDTDDSVARFHCGVGGENTYVNQTYARWVGVGKSELLGWNFLNVIHPQDVEHVRIHWDQCRREHRQYRMTHRVVTSGGSIITMAVTATPIPEGGVAKRWIGFARKVPNDTELSAG